MGSSPGDPGMVRVVHARVTLDLTSPLDYVFNAFQPMGRVRAMGAADPGYGAMAVGPGGWPRLSVYPLQGRKRSHTCVHRRTPACGSGFRCRAEQDDSFCEPWGSHT